MCSEVAAPGAVVMQIAHFAIFGIHVPAYATNHHNYLHLPPHRIQIFLGGFHWGVL